MCFSGPVARVLLFNTSGERDAAAMLKLLVVSPHPSLYPLSSFTFTLPGGA